MRRSTVRPDGARWFYSLDLSGIDAIEDWLSDLRAFWDRRLDALSTEITRGKRNTAARPEGLEQRVDIRVVQPYGCITMQTTLDFDQVFGALADATRRDIVRRALTGDEGVSELANHYPMSFAAVQKHVAILERAGLVTKRRAGRRKVVSTNVAALAMARRLLDRYEEMWRGRIDRMTDIITETEERP